MKPLYEYEKEIEYEKKFNNNNRKIIETFIQEHDDYFEINEFIHNKCSLDMLIEISNSNSYDTELRCEAIQNIDSNPENDEKLYLNIIKNNRQNFEVLIEAFLHITTYDIFFKMASDNHVDIKIRKLSLEKLNNIDLKNIVYDWRIDYEIRTYAVGKLDYDDIKSIMYDRYHISDKIKIYIALEELKYIDLKSIVFDYHINDDIRFVSLKKLNYDDLKDFVYSSSNYKLYSYALEKLDYDDLIPIVSEKSVINKVRIDALKRYILNLKDNEYVTHILYLEKISPDEMLLDFVLNDTLEDNLRILAFELIKHYGMLVDILSNTNLCVNLRISAVKNVDEFYDDNCNKLLSVVLNNNLEDDLRIATLEKLALDKLIPNYNLRFNEVRRLLTDDLFDDTIIFSFMEHLKNISFYDKIALDSSIPLKFRDYAKKLSHRERIKNIPLKYLCPKEYLSMYPYDWDW